MVELPSATYDGVFICDEVRREDNGKLLVIGLYTSNILLSEVPVDIGLSLVLRLVPKKQETIGFKLRVLANGDPVQEMHGTFKPPNLGGGISATPRFGVHIKAYGKLDFQIGEEAGDWQTLITVPVDPMTSSSA